MEFLAKDFMLHNEYGKVLYEKYASYIWTNDIVNFTYNLCSIYATFYTKYDEIKLI